MHLNYDLPDFDRDKKKAVGDLCTKHGADSALWRNAITERWNMDVLPQPAWEQMQIDKFEAALDSLEVKYERIA